MAENKTKPTEVRVEAFLEAVPDPVRRADGKALSALMARASGREPVMWGPSIVGFGLYRYRYESGREGEMCRVGFSPRKAELVIYGTGSAPGRDALLARLGKHKTGKGCLYVKRLADVDLDVLDALIRAGFANSLENHPD